MSGEKDTATNGDDPIDAQFEPAPPAADYVEKLKKAADRPGWTALGLTGLAATVLGGLVGAGLANTTSNGAFAPETLVSDVQEVVEDQTDQANRFEGMIESLDDRVSREIATVAAARGDAGAIQTLADEIASLNQRVEALDVTNQEVGEAAVWDFGALEARVEALETADEDDVTSPRIANRAITALRSRVEEMEAEAEERREALQGAYERLALLETSVAENNSQAQSSVDAEAFAELRAELADLKETRANAQAAEAAELQQLTRELRENEQRSQTTLSETRGATSAAFAMLSVDAAARDGRPFQSAYAQLETALPGNRSVAKLKPLATRGVTTMSVLQSRFESAREAAANAATISETSGKGEGWGWVRRAFGDSVSVRRTDQPDDTFDEAMRAAQSALTRRDLGGAINEVETLEGPKREAFNDWVAEAKDRKTLEDALDEVRLTLMTSER